MSSTIKYNSKGQRIEELDIEIIEDKSRGPFQSPKPVSPKKLNQEISPSNKTEQKPLLNDEEEEILCWCDAYLNLKKKGNPIYKF